MTTKRYAIVCCRTQHDDQLTLDALASRADIHPVLLERFVEMGLLEPVESEGPTLLFDWSAIVRVRTIRRLRQNLGINLAGVGVVLELVDRLRSLERENQELRHKLEDRG